MSENRALALGHYTDARYHPFAGVDQELEGIFEGRINVRSTDEYALLRPEQLADYRLFISYAEFVSEKLTPGQTASLLSFVAQGGGLLAVHNGISLQRNHELAGMIGARFTHHPPFTALPVHIREPEHPIMQGLEPFVIDDEPYRFDFSPLLETTILAEYEHEGQRWPAAWAHAYGLGRIVYLMPGHQLSAFQVDAYRRLIRNAGLWAAGLL